jgi:glycosyltransferase involved in cell wall biosynthesis
MGRRPTVFIDFSLIDFRTHVTGIPRVAYSYLEEGYVLSKEQRTFDVVPVYVRDGQLVDARPLLVKSNLRRLRRAPTLGAVWQVLRSLAYFATHGARMLAFTAITPFFVIANALMNYSFFNFWEHKLAAVFKRGYEDAKDVVNARFTRRLGFSKGDALFMPAYWHDTPPGYYARLRREGLVICPMLHDVLPITHAKYYQSPWRDMFKRYVLELLASHADHVHYISAFTRDELARIAKDEGLSHVAPGKVLHHGYDFGEGAATAPISGAVARVLDDPAPFFLMVGSIEPKKNHVRVLEEFETLWQQRKSARLVVVGRLGWKDKDIRRALLHSPHLHANLVWLDSVNDSDLRRLYEKATGVIQASVAEGFGLPILEALSLGAPVLANDIPVFREVGGPYVTYFEMETPGALARRIDDLITSGRPPLRRAFTWPTWRELYADLLALASGRQPETRPTSHPTATAAPTDRPTQS